MVLSLDIIIIIIFNYSLLCVMSTIQFKFKRDRRPRLPRWDPVTVPLPPPPAPHPSPQPRGSPQHQHAAFHCPMPSLTGQAGVLPPAPTPFPHACPFLAPTPPCMCLLPPWVGNFCSAGLCWGLVWFCPTPCLPIAFCPAPPFPYLCPGLPPL